MLHVATSETVGFYAISIKLWDPELLALTATLDGLNSKAKSQSLPHVSKFEPTPESSKLLRPSCESAVLKHILYSVRAKVPWHCRHVG